MNLKLNKWLVCTCCCHDSKCNSHQDCQAASNPNIECETIDESKNEEMVTKCSGNQLGDICTFKCPMGKDCFWLKCFFFFQFFMSSIFDGGFIISLLIWKDSVRT